MSGERKAPVRCAVYTRKSSEEGLEQSFNSLDAQREACHAYILSQRQEGWRAIDAQYDDGGYSGGSTDRPDLQRLLRDCLTAQLPRATSSTASTASASASHPAALR